MTRRERVMAVVEGRTPDHTPSAFCLHFPSGQESGEAAVQAHLRFFEETDGDICKIMNEHLLRGRDVVETPADLAKERLSEDSIKGIDSQVEMVKRIMDGLSGDGVALGTIHGPMVSIQHMSGRKGFFTENIDFYRRCKDENPKALMQALDVATEALCDLTRRCIDAGMDGIYYAALGAETCLFTDEEYNEYVRPFDLRVFEAAAHAPAFNLIHPCKANLSLERFKDYPAQVFSWEIHQGNLSLEEGFATFGQERTVLGGLDNNKGPLIEGTMEEIETAVHGLLRRAQGHRFILGADCTLPTGLDTARLRAAANACKTYKG